jgi:hypothetical protein
MGNPPSVTYPSPNEWLETVFPITAITNASQAQVTCSAYPFDSADIGITQVMFKQVQGMLPVNGMQGLIIDVIDPSNFVVNINSTQFPAYTSGGVICIDTGEPPVETQGQQTLNTPFHNIL